HWRNRVFEKTPSPGDLAERARIQADLAAAVREAHDVEASIRNLKHQQQELSRNAEVLQAHERRRRIEVEAELARLRLIREAVISSRGMRRAGYRPSAWWFRLVCPDGLWFRETVDSAMCYLEPLT
ncbi:MAG TPA: hypothetical protein VG820_12885, partial [Fimbriimonadaceae bacterium]|nr:hypothetical protein [Fimbriimonadaceae bacterium]